jgi:4-amino-4-deoxy-L-arabinose transferase-like glycosyltransferase
VRSNTSSTAPPAVVDRPSIAWRQITPVALGLAAVLVATINSYGYHRDELYFRLLGQHPAWGFVDQPPATPLLARGAIEVFGDSLWAIRVPAVLCVVGAVFLAALIAREFGGGALAQTCAAAGIVSPFPLVAGHVLVTATLDLAVWMAVVLFAARALLRSEPRWWLAAGAVVGLGLYNKLLVVLLLIGFGAGLLLVGPRRVLGSGWLWTGVALAAVIGAPNLLYQVVNDFPQSKMAAALAENKGDEARVLFVPFQLLLLGPPLVAVWVAGLVALWRRTGWRPARALAVAYPVICVLVLYLAGQPYYTLGLVVALYAIGCVPLVDWLRRGARPRGRRAVVAAGFALNIAVAVALSLPVVPVGVLGRTFIPALNQVTRDQVGWPAYVRQVAAATARLSPEERARAVIITGNYGEAGAIDRFGGAYRLPGVYSGQNELYNLGPPPESADVAVVVSQAPAAWFAEFFASCETAGRLDNGVGVANEENDEAAIYLCRGRKTPWRELWPRFQHYD